MARFSGLVSRVLAALVVVLACGTVSAEDCPNTLLFTAGQVPNDATASRADAACAAAAGKLTAALAGTLANGSSKTYEYVSSSAVSPYKCIAKETYRSCTQSGVCSTSINENYSLGMTTKIAPDPQCTSCAADAGKKKTVNITSGYTRVSNVDALSAAEYKKAWVGPVYVLPQAPTTFCDGMCEATSSAGNATRAWGSKVPTANGLYRHSIDYDATMSGKSCGAAAYSNPATAAASPSTAAPACDGVHGSVNGQETCIAPSPNTTTPPANASGVDVQGNPTAGPAGTAGASGGNGGTTGRVPVNGDGGPGGGPGAAGDGYATGPGGSGTGSLPTVTDPGSGDGSGNGSGSGTNEPSPTDCDKYPDSLACMKVGTPQDVPFTPTEQPVQVALDGGWGVVAAACPPPIALPTHFGTFSLSWQPVCDFASLLRGVVVAIAALAAARIFIGGINT